MVTEVNPETGTFVLRFGGGLNSRATEDEVDPRECVSGKNFDLDLENNSFRRRKPFDLIATATNGEPVNSLIQHEKVDGSISTLVQAGGTVYDWDFASTFTSVGTVSTAARLRGGKRSTFALDDEVIITDLGLQEEVKTWDGTTFTDLGHNLGSFKAKYCTVDGERAYYANVVSGTATPHLLVGSARGDKETLSVTDRPSSALSEADPFFIPTQDLRPINGLVSAFGLLLLSTEGHMEKLSGSSAQDFVLDDFYPDSGAAGDEAITFIGNDVLWGRGGRIETLFATENLGDVEVDDLTRKISTEVEDVNDWVIQYNSRFQMVYVFDKEQSRMFAFHKAIADEVVRQAALRRTDIPRLSPWSVWKTDHSFGFQPVSTATMKRPSDGLEFTYCGGRNGEIFQLEGGGGQDGGTTDIECERLSGVIALPENMEISGVEGWISYRKTFAATVTLTLAWGGNALFDETITISLPAAENLPVYGGSLYYNDSEYYSTPFKGRFSRQHFTVPGQANHMQVKVNISGATEFNINEIGFRFLGS